MVISLFSKYLNWLNAGVPKREKETYPRLTENSETNLTGLFVIGDLTGVPLLKLAVKSGIEVWKHTYENKSEDYDAIIIGAGPSGIACAIEAKRLGKKCKVLESNVSFQTILSYPKGKPIFAYPDDLQLESPIALTGKTKEALLAELTNVLDQERIEVETNARVTNITKNKSTGGFEVQLTDGIRYSSKNVILAIGKSGDPKRLSIPGEDSAHVFYRLIDPKDTSDHDVVIVGGGDSAIEAAIAAAPYAKTLHLVYKGKELVRPKVENLKAFQNLVAEGKIQFHPEAKISEIKSNSVVLLQAEKGKKILCSQVFILIGSKAPINFLHQIGILMENQWSKWEYFGLVSALSFASFFYFGKASFYTGFFATQIANFSLFIGFISLLPTLYGISKTLLWSNQWTIFRNVYLSFVLLYFTYTYVSSKFFGVHFLSKLPSFHYTFLYSLTILVFGIRRMYIRKTEYIAWQTSCLIFIQVFFLFLLPEIIFPYLGKNGFLGGPDSFVNTQIFPNGAYWKAYGFILLWPLSMSVLYDGSLTYFWLVYGLTTTFVLLPILVIRYGKGAYCGWICSCGGLAETLGDEHRQKMPHSKLAYRWEHSGQIILGLAFLLTLGKLSSIYFWNPSDSQSQLGMFVDSVKWMYDLLVDIGLAGVLGVGLYFFFSGRIWCRMFCPLAALMHIYAKFTQFRIFAKKEKCISCNICTKNCHQGIDVMSYANQGRPMDSVQCVRCSACVSLCPTDVLSFGRSTNQGIFFDTLQAKNS
ncbi:pyridine nucleotide-disulfide oxidoreductase [Leptospira ryugenii]|uniref:Pyridine nucleotide-disulfide oxidoreductase n=1 Tax=Leptospira ryugenii TaxID=1917863 RepID=A0A2P2DZ52_9LEPT|nr:NAD(P)-binding domain-containing protein [Leptospira ryugenii]GBF49909.1 pyridine nucleotide-disulfide oxidoreductase [Leptospira ryugenii]